MDLELGQGGDWIWIWKELVEMGSGRGSGAHTCFSAEYLVLVRIGRIYTRVF